MKKGEQAGEAEYYLDGKKIGSVKIVFSEGVRKAGYGDYVEKIWKKFLGGHQTA